MFAIITPAIFRKQKWVPADDGIEEKQDNEVGDDEDVFKSIVDRANDRIKRRNAAEEHQKMIKRDYTFEYVPTFDFSERQLLEASKMFLGPYGAVADVEVVKFQLDAAGKARAKVRAQERLAKIREIERKRRHKMKMDREKQLLEKQKGKKEKGKANDETGETKETDDEKAIA